MTLRYVYTTVFVTLAVLASAALFLGNQRQAFAETVPAVPVDPCEDIFSQLPFPNMECGEESNDDEVEVENPPVDPCGDIFPHIPNMPECESDNDDDGGGGGGGNEEPTDDVCPNIDGQQTEIPDGKIVENGECVDAPDDSGSGGGSGGGSSSSGGGGGGGGGGGSVLGTTTPAVCEPYITTFMRRGQSNDAKQVLRLQSVLKTFENMEVAETGEFDAISEAAVKAFQLKYADEVLTPWGIQEPTGYVFLTTRKKLNEVYCDNAASFPLTEEEQMHIELTKGVPVAAVSASPVATPIVPDTEPVSADAETESESVVTTVAEEPQAPVRGNRITDFFRRLFGRFR